MHRFQGSKQDSKGEISSGDGRTQILRVHRIGTGQNRSAEQISKLEQIHGNTTDTDGRSGSNPARETSVRDQEQQPGERRETSPGNG